MSIDGRPHFTARVLRLLALVSLLFSGAMFGFFFAWACSTLWGLDTADPNVAIAAMQAMNASVRNWLFAPAFFGTPVLLAATALVAWKVRETRTAATTALAGVLYILGVMLPTALANVPMNEALALVQTPLDAAQAAAVWRDYSGGWQLWNAVRAVVAALVLLLAGAGLARGR